jgi:hypothetical protein
MVVSTWVKIVLAEADTLAHNPGEFGFLVEGSAGLLGFGGVAEEEGDVADGGPMGANSFGDPQVGEGVGSGRRV